jgi:hypothetical protein
VDVSPQLYGQLVEIFPRGIPKPIFEKYLQNYPAGIPEVDFIKLKDIHLTSRLSSLNEDLIKRRRQDSTYTSNDFLKWILGNISVLIMVISFIGVTYFLLDLHDEYELLNWINPVFWFFMVMTISSYIILFAILILRKLGQSIHFFNRENE